MDIYTTGAYLRPIQVTDSESNPKWVWTVSEFNDDSFLGGTYCQPLEQADTRESLIKKEEDTL